MKRKSLQCARWDIARLTARTNVTKLPYARTENSSSSVRDFQEREELSARE